ncbi:hypothetical protein GA0070606_6294 [Micromonospora citrea]|uniref:Uncharacterized protein n=1 Tax=Micromonospora citrea TaxID=47855 RepID=A0A1C6W2J6_9ACTN|nr:hypothetical protein GA0070606_6294 [Micromonospora citrea]
MSRWPTLAATAILVVAFAPIAREYVWLRHLAA